MICSVWWFLIITMPSSLWFHKTIFMKHCRVEILAWHHFSVCSCTEIVFQFLLPFPSSILCCISAQTLPPATMCSYYSLYQVWHTWAYSLVFVQLACWHTDISVGSRDGCCHSITESIVDVPIRLFQQIFSARTACSHALLHNLQHTSDNFLIFTSHLANGMIPVIAIIFRVLCLHGTRSLFKLFF